MNHATFTTDLSDSIAAQFSNLDCLVVAMNDGGQSYLYPPRVGFEIDESDIGSYRKPEQITSGTLAYAVGSGKAVISTPYLYARELLADGRGILVPWRDSQTIARAVVDLLSDDAKRLALCTRAAAHGRSMVWPAVARRYVQSFEQARSRRRSGPRVSRALDVHARNV
jgi:glycosyltransferase involved in cell wall biosynthesis